MTLFLLTEALGSSEDHVTKSMCNIVVSETSVVTALPTGLSLSRGFDNLNLFNKLPFPYIFLIQSFCLYLVIEDFTLILVECHI
jgi:hypothetical protein